MQRSAVGKVGGGGIGAISNITGDVQVSIQTSQFRIPITCKRCGAQIDTKRLEDIRTMIINNLYFYTAI
ncbi:MAG: hypothetical protein ACE5KT_02355 [Methanosarcinales archaeon]